MQGYKTKDIMMPFYDMPKDYNELVKVYRTLAKSADQRLVRLEEYSKLKDFENVKKWAYAKAMTDIKKWSGAEANRFNTKPPESKVQLLAKINDMKEFLESKTSTKKGIQQVFMKRANTVNKKFGTNFTWQNIGDFFESKMYAKLDSDYDSATIVEAFGVIQKAEEKKKKALQKAKEENKVIRVSGDDILQQCINDMLNNYDEDVRELLGE